VKVDSSDDVRYSYAIESTTFQCPSKAVDESTGYLHFYAMSAKFSIPEDHLEDIIETLWGLDGDKNSRHICLLDSSGLAAGVLIADAMHLKSSQESHFECIAIVQSTLSRIIEDPSWDEESKSFLSPILQFSRTAQYGLTRTIMGFLRIMLPPRQWISNVSLRPLDAT
jgi:hypothetical protein